MPDSKDPRELLKSLNIEAIGKRVAESLAEWLVNPELYQVLSNVHAQNQSQQAQESPKATCSREGCNEPVRAKGLCAKHYQRHRYAQKRAESPRTSGRGFGECSHEGCSRKVHARGMCGAHFMEWVRDKRKEPQDDS